MKTPIKAAFRGLAALTLICLAANARADIIENHVVVTSPYYGGNTPGYDASYALQLGTGSWPFPYVDVRVANAVGKSSYAKLSSAPSYLTYLHDVSLFSVTPGAEISSKTLSDGSFTSFFNVASWNVGPKQDIVSPDGNSPDIYLGFSIKTANSPAATPSFGWMHLTYTQSSGLKMVSSAMTTTDAGIYALSQTTIPAVDELGTQVLALMGAAGLVASQLRRRRQSA